MHPDKYTSTETHIPDEDIGAFLRLYSQATLPVELACYRVDKILSNPSCMLRWVNLRWYGGLTAAGAYGGKTMHDVADRLGIEPNLNLLQLLGLAFVFSQAGTRAAKHVQGRTDSMHNLNRDVRSMGSQILRIVNGSLLRPDVDPNLDAEYQLQARRILQLWFAYISICGNFADPHSDAFKRLFAKRDEDACNEITAKYRDIMVVLLANVRSLGR